MKKLKSGVVWIEAAEGTIHPVNFNVNRDEGATEKEIEASIREELPSAGMIVFSNVHREYVGR